MEALIFVAFFIIILMGIGAFLDFLTYMESPKKSNNSKPINENTEINNKKTVERNDLIRENRISTKIINTSKTTNLSSTILNIEEPESNVKQSSIAIETNELKIIEPVVKSQIISEKQLTGNKMDDNSIIDITPTQSLNTYYNLKKYGIGVPYWSHQYVYSYSEINIATKEQKEFYVIFKNCFLKGEYLDLEGNTNYAFILLFDLLNTCDSYSNLSELENQIKALGQNYPKTKSYGISFLIKKMESKGNTEEVSRLRNENYNLYQNNYDYENYRLGTKYKTKLNLKDYEVDLLNKLWYPSNNFCNIEFCCKEIIKLYLATIVILKEEYIEQGSTLDSEIISISEEIAKRYFTFKKEDYNFKYCVESVSNNIHQIFFKHCENAVRNAFSHKRRLSTDVNIFVFGVNVKFNEENVLISKYQLIISSLISNISLPDDVTEIELNSQNTTRWKIRFEELTTNFQDNSIKFFDEIISLGNLNIKNPSVENIFFDASKFISKSDKEVALKLYVYYLHYDLKSVTFDNKQLTKTIQKNLFKTNEQLHQFEVIVSEFIKDKDLDKALEGISSIYAIKRKKIQIDSTLIKEVQEQHSETVELLNEYLKDEYENDNNSVKTQEINDDEIEIEITQKNEISNTSIYLSEIPFTPIQISILDTFIKNNYAVPQSDLELFAKSKGLFKNQLIDNINEMCYEILDDVLIEDEDDYNTINPQYYQRILAV